MGLALVGMGGGGALGLQGDLLEPACRLRFGVMQPSEGDLEQTDVFSYIKSGEPVPSDAGLGDRLPKIGEEIWSGDRDLVGDLILLLCLGVGGFAEVCAAFSIGMSSSHFCMLLCLVSVADAEQF